MKKYALKKMFIILFPLCLAACSNSVKYAQVQGLQQLVPESSSNKRLATGFFVSNEGHFLTNYHVTKGSQEISITTYDGRKVPARVLKENPEIDIVLAKAEVASKGVTIGTRAQVAKGDEVFTLGYPLFVIQGSEQKATFGRINAYSGIRNDQKVYQIDVPLQPGNSGGPLISEHGVVVGVIKATFNQLTAMQTLGTLTQNINYAVKTDEIVPMLEDVLGSQLKYGSRAQRQTMPDLINRFEKSVVLVEAL